MDGGFIYPDPHQRDMHLNYIETIRPHRLTYHIRIVLQAFFSTKTEAIEKANNSEFGLYAAVFTQDLDDRTVRLAKALGAGTVGVNCTSSTNARDTAFGGFKMSGNSRKGFLYSLDSSLETKSILIKATRL